MSSALVVGSGLIGTSVGLALVQTSAWRVLLSDTSAASLDIAVQRGAGSRWNGAEQVDLVVLAVPPAVIARQLKAFQGLDIGQTYTHVASVQSQVQREVEALSCDLSAVVGGHPMAGRETSGPSGASGDLFVGRPWVLCPTSASSASSVDQVRALALACGAVPLVVDPVEHDRAVAVLSHLPQVVSSALAALLVPADPVRDATGSGEAPLVPTSLSGAGLADTTRLAASAPALWTEILSANAGFVAPAVRELVVLLSGLAEALEAANSDDPRTRGAAHERVTDLLRRGNRGRALVPVKRGVRDAGFAAVAVEVDDRPGRLAALLVDAGAAQVNVEDVRVDHVPGRPTGVIELLVTQDAADGLAAALTARAWRVLGRWS